MWARDNFRSIRRTRNGIHHFRMSIQSTKERIKETSSTKGGGAYEGITML